MPTFGVATFVRPLFDVATTYGNYYMGLAMEYARQRMTVRDLSGPDATTLNIFASLEEDDPMFCYFLGHGNADFYTAQDQEVVFQTCQGNERMIGRNLLLLSCSCGIRLGPDTADKGALAVHCWAVDFTWVAVEDPPDLYAQGFFEAVNAISKAHVDGFTPNQAHLMSLEVWEQWIDYWAASPDEYASLVIQHLIHDRDGMRLFGIGDTPSSPGGGIMQPSAIELPLIAGTTLLFFSLI